MNKKYGDILEFNINITNIDDMVSVTVYQKKMINQLIKLAEDHPEEVRVVAVNNDGTTVVHLPKKYVHVSFYESSRKKLSEDQKAAAAERLRKARKKKAELNG